MNTAVKKLGTVLLFFMMACKCAFAESDSAEPKADPIQVLIIDGQNKHHNWQVTTPILKNHLEASGRFQVDVATTPPPKHDMSEFRPKFAQYEVVLSNYDGEGWPQKTQREFQAFVHNGGGFVTVHAANNAFPDWPEYNEIIGLGGWGKRNEKWGPYVYYQDGVFKRDASKGRGGAHGPQREFVVEHRDCEHPITRGLPMSWMHAKDELYQELRGPAKNLHVLATAYADPEFKGTGRHEPMLMTINYGQGRVFHTTLGHADYSMRCVGFITTLLRGTEWAATGKVTIDVPADFPTVEESNSREFSSIKHSSRYLLEVF